MTVRPDHLLNLRLLPQVSCGRSLMVRTLLVTLLVLLLQSGRAEATCGDYLLHVPGEIKVDGVLAFEIPGDRQSMPAHPGTSPCANGECRPAPAPTPEPPPLPVRDRTVATILAGERPSDFRSSGRLALRRSVRALDGVPLSIDRPPRQSGESC